MGTSGDRIKPICPSPSGDKVCSCLSCGETPFSLFIFLIHFLFISINETLKKGQNLTIIRETWVWIGKALYFFISQCRIYGVFSSAEWNHPCKVCGNLDVRDAIISSRKNSEFFQLECAEFGEFHICIIAVKGISASFECHISWFASAAIQDILVKTFKILIVELY